MPYELPKLAHAYDAYAPHIDARTMELHHTKHHQAYVTNANNLLKSYPALDALGVNELIARIREVPAEVRTGLRNNAGGHANHSFFWNVIAPGAGGRPVGALAAAIEGTFGGFEPFKEAFAKAATGRFGSGWAWLVVTHRKELMVGSTANQDSPLMGSVVAGLEGTPIIGLDVWEHAYYLAYQNRRADYIAAFWNLVDWGAAASRYDAAMTA
ncbi:MAG: superoxide dismutase [Opitutaceae bacterium]|jgi:Fe-Mn family superoxide dismutase|nr:superoxide dismutase [Opitutaceae bacterium]